MQFPMRAAHPIAAAHRSLTWLVWLALLLPVAQSGAIWHAYSHSPLEAGGFEDDKGDKGAPAAAPCDLCLTASGVSGGALPAATTEAAVSAARHAVPPAPLLGTWLAPLALAYLSRAPPPALR